MFQKAIKTMTTVMPVSRNFRIVATFKEEFTFTTAREYTTNGKD